MNVQVSSDLWVQPKVLAMGPADETQEEKDNRDLWLTRPIEMLQEAWLQLKGGNGPVNPNIKEP